MAKILKNYQPRKRSGPEPKYDWPEWLDGKVRRLKRTDDFDCTLESFENLARHAAKRRGMTVSIFQEPPDCIVIEGHPQPLKKELKT